MKTWFDKMNNMNPARVFEKKLWLQDNRSYTISASAGPTSFLPDLNTFNRNFWKHVIFIPYQSTCIGHIYTYEMADDRKLLHPVIKRCLFFKFPVSPRLPYFVHIMSWHFHHGHILTRDNLRTILVENSFRPFLLFIFKSFFCICCTVTCDLCQDEHPL